MRRSGGGMERYSHVVFKGLIFFLLLEVLTVWLTEAQEKFPLLMPNVRPEKPDAYLCTPVRIDPSKEYYITGFQPNATMETAHHMLLYGCEEPGSSEKVWNCGEMALAQKGFETAPTCGRGAQIIYAWAMDAPALTLPEGVAFKVGGQSNIQYLVLQVHYSSVDKFKDGSTDDSGIIMYYKDVPSEKQAGVLLLGTAGRISPHSVEYMETACTLQEEKEIHPFAFRTHTHALGRVVSGYKVQRHNSLDEWNLIGKKDPQLPQMFYPTENVVINKGDTVAARCTMESNRDRVTRVGSTGNDEMCNFYIMYWTKGDVLDQKACFSMGPPFYYWSRAGLNNIPDKDASSLPVGTSAKETGLESHRI